uniref:VWFD domain-containing protein n=1 Tax=Sparus aurata TaxID=8175 RepID=A0A671UAZ1_SPAAU
MTYCFSIPIQNGESWKVSNCTMATCTNGKIMKTPKPCPTVSQPICANGNNAVKIYDNDGCCFRYECECTCSLVGRTHYITFDGKSYTFNKLNCSYYLVKEIITKYNLTIMVSNSDCSSSETAVCPQVFTVIYQSYKVVFSQLKTSEGSVNMVHVNQKRIYPAYSNSVLRLTGTDIVTTLVIPKINTTVVYSSGSISIELPYSLFYGNTEGQCGTCDNSQTNDCRSPNGQVESCSDSAGQWHVQGETCVTPKPTETTTAATATTRSPTTQPTCKPAICDLLTTSVFQPCHSVISPGPFVDSCVSDNCNGGNNTCSSLEAYATQCSNKGICINWRNATNGQCEHKCPSNKVYKACGPSVEPTCDDRYNKLFQANQEGSTNDTKEGCFCREGTTLFNTVYDTCVTSCGCVGPDGKPKQPGDKWTSNCKTCMCDKDSMSVQCEPVQCPSIESPTCGEPGQQLVNKTDGCCSTQSCAPSGTSAPSAGESSIPGPCQECYCGPKMDPITKLNIIMCKPIVCNKNCSEGYEYQTVTGKCCGTCVQKSCIVTTADHKAHIIEVSAAAVFSLFFGINMRKYDKQKEICLK